MILKKGVLITGVQPEIVLAIIIIEPICDELGVDLVITSCRDGEHSKNSKHKLGFAIDIRTRDLQDQEKIKLAQDIRAALTSEFFVLLEGDHIHIQFNGIGL